MSVLRFYDRLRLNVIVKIVIIISKQAISQSVMWLVLGDLNKITVRGQSF